MSQADSPNTMSPSRRTVLAGISVAVAPAVPAVDKSLGAVALPDDPIFAVIKAHHQAMAHEINCVEAADVDVEAVDGAEEAEVQQRMHEAYDLHHDAIVTLLTTDPTTLAGAVALLEYVGSPEYPDEATPLLFNVIDVNDERIPSAVEAFPTRLAASIRRLIAQGNADAPLSR